MTRIIWNQTTASGRRTSWAKPFDRVDTTLRKGAQAFCYGILHQYLQDGVETDLPEGTLVLEVRPRGSVKNGHQEAFVYAVVEEDSIGKMAPIIEGYNWRKQYLSLVDECQEALGRRALADDPDSNPLAEYTTEQLLQELERRGMARVD